MKHQSTQTTQGTQATEENTGAAESVNRLNDELNKLCDVVGLLIIRMSPLLLPDNSDCCAELHENNAKSQIRVAIEECRGRVNLISNTLISAINRIDL